MVSFDLYEHVLLKFMLSLWNQQYFAASLNFFAQKPWNICEMVFIEIRAETDVSTGMAGKAKANGKHFTDISTINHM